MLCVCLVVPAYALSRNEGFGDALLFGVRTARATDGNAEPGTLASYGRLYGIGSVSKVFTAAAVMKLVEEGKVDLDESLTAYIPEFRMADARYTRITPRMLLNHSCGLMGMTDNNAFLLGDNDTDNHDRFLDLVQTQALKHDPGERSIYCNDAFTLAELLVERVSGMGFTEYIEQNFLIPLGIEGIKSPQSEFDRAVLADIYLGNNALRPEVLGVIGSGGLYASMEDLCAYATIFMDSADGSILSRQSTDEMAKSQHANSVVPSDADSGFSYGLGWDSVGAYPLTHYGIKALSKGGGTGRYHTNLTVLPEYNLAAAVSSSGTTSMEQQIAQQIILAVLAEEGLIPADAAPEMPVLNRERALVPEDVKAYAGIYNAGLFGQWSVEFTEDSLILTPLMVRNELPQEYAYNTDGEFVSLNDDYLGFMQGSAEGARGATAISFAEGKYLVIRAYEDVPGLGLSASVMPLAERIEDNPVPAAAHQEWQARNDKEYLLVSEKYSSMHYLKSSVAKTHTDDRIYGYVGMGLYKTQGASINMARITDGSTAVGFQSTPTMTGRDTNNLSVSKHNGIEYLSVNHYRYVDASAAQQFSEASEMIVLESETIWFDIDNTANGRTLNISTPQNGAWFVYDSKMNCIATSLEKHPRDTIILPKNGRLALAGEAGAEFILT